MKQSTEENTLNPKVITVFQTAVIYILSMAIGGSKALGNDFANNFGIFFGVLGLSTLISLLANKWVKKETLELTKTVILKNLGILLSLALVFAGIYTNFVSLKKPTVAENFNSPSSPQTQQAQILAVQKAMENEDIEIIKKEYAKLEKIGLSQNTELDKLAEIIKKNYEKYYQVLSNYQAKVTQLDNKIQNCVIVENPQNQDFDPLKSGNNPQTLSDPLKSGNSSSIDLNFAELDAQEYEILRKEKLEIAKDLQKKLECAKKLESEKQVKIEFNSTGKDLETKIGEEIKVLESAKFKDEAKDSDPVGDLRNSDEKLTNILENLEKGDFVDLENAFEMSEIGFEISIDENIQKYKDEYKKATNETSILIKFGDEIIEE